MRQIYYKHTITSFYTLYERYDTLSKQAQEYCISELQKYREKIVRCFGAIGSRIKLPESLLQIINKQILISECDSESDNNGEDLDSEHI